ncbi:phage filamentation protein Fil family protein [Erwinia pyrifoliae]|nr:phage filamentation protein Fil family protein [Erwinia pyrifoliae]MCT2387319.1 DUF2724 domain-containing protein [Erwinia pyrifoliae]MCU8587081.1 DUF2724 domain-containing protein [Erwinia pyrifoliae]
MTTAQCPSLSAMLTHCQAVTHRRHSRGWIETPDERFFQPKATDVQFIKGCRTPFIVRPRRKARWFARLMGVFA